MKVRWYWFWLLTRCHVSDPRLCLCVLLLALLSTATYARDCTISVTATGVAFGNYSFTNLTATDATGNIQVSCRSGQGIDYEILLSTGGSGNYASREMTSGANKLQYNLYIDAGYSVVWGDGHSGTSKISGEFRSSQARNHSVYGRLPAGQNMPAGVYTDTIIVTINF